MTPKAARWPVSNNLSDVANKEAARNNLEVFSKDDIFSLAKTRKGALNIKLAKAATSLTSVPPALSILFDLQMDYADWTASADYSTLIGWPNTGTNGVTFYRGAGTMALSYNTGGGVYKFAEIPEAKRQSICDGNLNALALIVNSQGFFIYKNGAKIHTYSSNTFPTEEWTADNGFAVGGTTTQKCKIGRVRLFNFDVSATGAPYTLADFQNGVEIPFALLDASAESRALVALEDFTYTAGATKKISDYSGGGYDASVTAASGGYFIGDNDTRVAALQRMVNLWTQS